MKVLRNTGDKLITQATNKKFVQMEYDYEPKRSEIFFT
jgi:hypothetical protein